MTNREAIKKLLMSGYNVEFGALSICNLARHTNTRGLFNRKYQVDSNTGKFLFSEIYSDIDIAIDKFLGIRNILLKK